MMNMLEIVENFDNCDNCWHLKKYLRDQNLFQHCFITQLRQNEKRSGNMPQHAISRSRLRDNLYLQGDTPNIRPGLQKCCSDLGGIGS